jgi:putative FmdB family regulatory protein
MPTYEYVCKSCNFELEELQSMSEAPLVTCPQCHEDALVRVISGGTSLVFKGSGFYLTDYKSKSSADATSKKSEPKEKPKPAAPPPSSEAPAAS